ncbi:MAG: hypothetical protein LBQ57_07735 [Spirochaetales bacterium]|nr:hypothetical protein [Spirochaetales bacterium]
MTGEKLSLDEEVEVLKKYFDEFIREKPESVELLCEAGILNPNGSFTEDFKALGDLRLYTASGENKG